VKNMPGILFWLFLPYHFIINIFSLFWFAVHGQGKVILRAKKDALMGLKPMWRKRVKIQSNRKASLLDILKMLDRHPIPKLDRFLSLFKPCR